MATTNPQPDLQALALTKAIRATESGGNYQASGDAGTSSGAYQYQPATWNAFSKEILGVDNAPMTEANQNAVTYGKVKQWKDQGLGPAQIAAAWNAGEGKATSGAWTSNIGVNNINGTNVSYNTPQYAQKVVASFKQIYPQVQQQYGGQNGDVSQTPSPPQDQGPSVTGFLGNVVNSAGNLLGGLGNVVMHPIDTATNLIGTAAGAAEKLAGVNNADTQKFDNIVHYFAGRYGGGSLDEIVSNIGHTLYTDPVGAALDLSTFLDGVGGAVGGLGKINDISKASELARASDYISTASGMLKTSDPAAIQALRTDGTMTKIANAVKTVSNYTNPLSPVINSAKGAIGIGGRIAGEALGQTTGAGFGAIKGAFDAGTEGGKSLAAVRAGISGGEEGANNLIDSAQQAFSDIKMQRSNDYQTALESIKQGTHTLSDDAMKQIYDTFDNLLNKYDVKVGKKGELNFSNSRLRNEPVIVGDIQDISKEIQKYLDVTKQITPVNIDDLKQYIDSRYAAGTRGSSLTSQLATKVRQTLRANVPRYEEMTKAYEQVSNDLKDFRQSLSIGGKASRETILKKLTSTLRNNNEYRQALLKTFSESANKDIFSQAAGVSLQSLIPLGLSKYAEGLAAFINPHVLMALPFSSPRLVGEFVLALGKGNKILENIGRKFVDYKGPAAVKTGIINNNAQSNISSLQVPDKP